MAKKNKKATEPVYKTLNELSDSEVIKYAEWMSYPLYLDQFNNSPLSKVETDTHLTTCDVEQIANKRLIQLQNGFYSVKTPQTVVQEPQNTVEDTQTKGKGKKVYSKKRGFFLFLITLLMLAMVAVVVLGVVKVDVVSDYVTAFNDGEKGLGILDPTLGLINSLLGDDIFESSYQSIIDDADTSDVKGLIPVYATCVASILIALCLVIGFIKALVALFSGKSKKDGYYKKFKFGYLSILIIISTLLFAVAYVYASGYTLTDLAGLINFSGEGASFGYGLYALIGGALLTFIFSCCSYKKAKK